MDNPVSPVNPDNRVNPVSRVNPARAARAVPVALAGPVAWAARAGLRAAKSAFRVVAQRTDLAVLRPSGVGPIQPPGHALRPLWYGRLGSVGNTAFGKVR